MIIRFYKTLQHLSIDIVIGAVVLLHFFSKPFEVDLDWTMYLVLGITVWLIYTADHLQDATRVMDSTRARYTFHLKYKALLIVAGSLMTIVATISLFFLPQEVLLLGSLLFGLCVFYLIFQSKLAPKGMKELYVSAIYALGILLAPISLSGSFLIHPFVILIILAFANLIIFSWFELEDDRKDSILSIATVLGKKGTEKLILIVASVGLSVGVAGIEHAPNHSLYFIAALILYAILLLNPQWSKKNERYRLIGDGAFVLPIFFEWL